MFDFLIVPILNSQLWVLLEAFHERDASPEARGDGDPDYWRADFHRPTQEDMETLDKPHFG